MLDVGWGGWYTISVKIAAIGGYRERLRRESECTNSNGVCERLTPLVHFCRAKMYTFALGLKPARRVKKFGGYPSNKRRKIMSFKIKLISTVSAFILVFSMLLVGVLATTSGFTIKLKGDIQFNIANSTLYIKDIRISNGLTEGETIDNFLPSFVNENFELDLGTVLSDSGTVSIEIDVINTTETVYSASSKSSIAGAVLSVSGTIAGDNVPQENVLSYTGISGTVQISISAASSTTINLNEIVVDMAETTEPVGYTLTLNNNDSDIEVWYKTDLNSLNYSILDSNSSVEINTNNSDSFYLYLTLNNDPYPFKDKTESSSESASIEPRRYVLDYQVCVNDVLIGTLSYVQSSVLPSTQYEPNEGGVGVAIPGVDVAMDVSVRAEENDVVETSVDESETILICKITKSLVIDIG